MKRDMVRAVFYLHVISERKVYKVLGFSSLYEYAAQAVGLGREQCKAFLRLGARLEDLPQMRRALEHGAITWRKASIIVGEAHQGNEAELIDAAQTLSEAELRSMSRAAKQPSPSARRPECSEATPPRAPQSPQAIPEPRPTLPDNPPAPRPADEVQHVTFRLSPEQYARWSALMGRLKRPKEEVLIEGMERLAMGEAKNVAIGGYLIILNQCQTCGQASQANARGVFEAPKALLEVAQCDGIIEDSSARRRRAIPPRMRRQVLKRDGYQCAATGCSHTNNLEMHHRIPVAQGGESTLDNLVTLCRRCHRRLHENEEALRVANRGPA
jgi:hypothetical protein